MTTVQELLTTTLNDYLLASQRDSRNVLLGAMDASQTTATFTYPLGGIQSGARLSIDLEDMYVFDVNDPAKSATVLRNDTGSTGVAHAAGSVVIVNPRWSSWTVLRAINAEVQALSAEGLYQMKTVNITYQAGVDGYDLGDATALDVWDVRVDSPGPEKDWPPVPFRWERSMPTTGTHAFASGVAVFPSTGEPGRSFRVFYRAPFSTTALAATTDVVETVTGIHTQAVDLLAIGAAVRLVSPLAVRRSRMDAQGDTRRGDEVTVNDSLQAVRGLLALRESRLSAEKARLSVMYPPRLRVR